VQHFYGSLAVINHDCKLFLIIKMHFCSVYVKTFRLECEKRYNNVAKF